MAITPLPSLDRTSPTFKTDVDTFFATQLPTFSEQVEDARVEIEAAESAATGAASTATTAAGTATGAASTATTAAGTATGAASTATTKAAEAAASAASITAQVEVAIHGATGKTAPVDNDEFGLVDTAASNVLKKLTWANMKAGVFAAWGALISGGTGKSAPVDADAFAMMDSAASNATKKLTWGNLKTTLGLPALAGTALNLIRVKADETGYEVRTPGQVLSDIGAQAAGSGSGILSLPSLTTPVSLIALRSYLAGCTMSTAGSSATMSVAAGTAMDSTNAYLMQLTAIAKTTSAWAVGTAQGGLDTGAIANNTWYHWFVIRRPDTGVVDALCSLSATAPTLPANYTQYRRIGSGRTNGSAQWTSFIQIGDKFLWTAPVLDINTASFAASSVLYTMTIPLGVVVEGLFQGVQSQGTSGFTNFWGPALGVIGVSGTVSPGFTLASDSATGQTVSRFDAYSNVSSQIYGAATAVTTVKVWTLGWRDSRGREA